jgi:2Fe-2S ferredoxin
MTVIKILPHAELCPEGKTIERAPGTSVCEALLENGVAIEHACDMSCACTTCHVIVREGFNRWARPTRPRTTCSIAPGA